MTELKALLKALLLAPGVVLIVLVAAAGSATAAPSAKPFEIVPGSFHFEIMSPQAGAHADWVTSFDLAHEPTQAAQTYGDLRTTVVELPAGFDASDTAVPTCPAALLLSQAKDSGSQCPPDTQVGTISLDLTFGTPFPLRETFPVYNLEVNSFGVTAMLGFNAIAFAQFLAVGVRPGDAGLTTTAPETSGVAEPHDVSVTIWAVPASPVHDAERGQICRSIGGRTEVTCQNGGQTVNVQERPLLSNPTACGSTEAKIRADSWEEPFLEEPALWSKAFATVGPITGCELIHFDPSIQASPTTGSAESPTGLDFSLLVPQTWEYPNLLSTSSLRDTVVALPRGMTVNPSAGAGLGACSVQQYESETSSSGPGEGCPPESKIGSIEIETPLLAEKIDGSVYVATPYDNPFSEPGHPDGSLLALYVVAKDPARGILLKVAGKVEPNPLTGQLVASFQDTPQQPFSRFTLKFRPGATAPLVSPATCGSYTAQAALTPWSAPEEPRHSTASFPVESGVGGGPCPEGGTPPFKPRATSGTINNLAGAYSPFYLRIERQDGEQEITGFSTQLPPGVSGNLSGIPFCGEAEIARARAQSGAEAQADPACPAASQIGHTIAEAGVGSVLAQTPGRLYLGGPFEGAPFSAVSITSAKVGPFDLGTVVVHLPLFIDPITAQVSIPQGPPDQIPHILQGIVIHLRAIRVYIDRERFMLNPTSCDPMSVSATVIGGGADPTNPAGYDAVTVPDRFQASDCASLGFKPAFRASTSAKTSRSQGASLHVSLVYPNEALGKDANIKSVHVELPKALPSRLSTLNHACVDSVFNQNPANCPSQSRVGIAKALTPALPVPLEGPAYFVSHGGRKFPELIIVLQGYGVTVDLEGETFISNSGITSSTFKSVPDVPVGSFELTLPEGPFSALAANRDLCSTSLEMPTKMIAQNGAVLEQKTKIAVNGCKPAIRVLGHNVENGQATLTVSVPAAGRLQAGGAGLTGSSKRLSKAGTTMVRLALSASERRLLASHPNRRLKAHVKLVFAPAHGKPLRTTVTVLIG